MAERFAAGGRLVAFGQTPAARSDARHVAVEFVHPVIVGKRALPALAIVSDGGPLEVQAALLVEPQDIAIGFGIGDGPDGSDDQTVKAMRLAAERGSLTIAFGDCGSEWEFDPPRDDPFVRQEMIETLYHVLWELVHIFFEHRGLLEGREAGQVHDTGASSFLYPFLAESEHDLDSILADIARSVVIKADEVAGLRERTLGQGASTLAAAAAAVRKKLDAGGRVLAFGNGGSATDAMDLVADLRSPPDGAGDGWPGRPAIELTEDASIITAVANDIGVEEIFQRQVIAYGREGDIAVAFSTSGGSENLLEALVEARRRGMLTVAFSGYDGGKIAAQGLADHLILSPSEYIPRIQEAQASAYHVLRELIELA